MLFLSQLHPHQLLLGAISAVRLNGLEATLGTFTICFKRTVFPILVHVLLWSKQQRNAQPFVKQVLLGLMQHIQLYARCVLRATTASMALAFMKG